jgi:hypothetical protein
MRDGARYPGYDVMVALGKVPGVTGLRKFGRNDDVDGDEEMWELGTTRVLPTSAGALSAVSSSVADDDTTGTGAWTIQVEGLDSNFVEISEVITMNGTGAVASVGTDWFRVNRAYVVTAGTGQVNAGNITVSIGGNAQAFIEANEGQTHQTHYTVPAGKSLVVTGITLVAGTLGNAHMVIESQIRLYRADGNSSWRSISAIDMTDGQTYSTQNSIPTVLPEKTDIRQKLIFSGTNGEVTGIFHGYLFTNEALALW